MNEKLLKEARKLEESLWAAAEQMGIKRTTENAAMLNNVISGQMTEAAKEIGFQYSDQPGDDAEIHEPSNANKIILACGFMCASLVIDHGEDGDGAWSMLCSANRSLGLLEASLGIDDIGKELSGMFSRIGLDGAQKRHAPMAALRSWAIERYKAGEWKSANQAAHALKESVIAYGRTINANLTEENAQRTIAEWIRKSV